MSLRGASRADETHVEAGSLAAELLAKVELAAEADLPVVLGALEQARARAWARLTAAASAAPAPKFLTVDEAAELARLPRRRIFSLARSKPWAKPVGRRLLIEERGFMAWIRDRDVTGEHETT